MTLRALMDGTLASLASGGALAWRGRAETGSAAAAINAPSHWFFGRESLRRNAVTLKYTGVGALTHHLSSVLWGMLYEVVRSRRRNPTVANAIADAVAVTAVAAVVDLKVAPERLTPGFERRLSNKSLVWVYASFGVGLALAGVLAQRQRS